MRRRDLIASICGACACWPVVIQAQQIEKPRRIAFVDPATPVEYLVATNPRFYGPFFEGLRQLGFIEGQNLAVERYSGAGQADRFAEIARNVVASQPEVIFCVSGRMARRFKAATETIPIVATVGDRVASGIVSNLAHSGGNITGVAMDGGKEFYAKYLELLRRIKPSVSKVAHLTPREISPYNLYAVLREAATQMSISLIPAGLDPPADDEEFRRVFAAISAENADGLIVADTAENGSHKQLIINLAEQARLPAVYPDRSYAERGGLMSYGVKAPDAWRHAGTQVGQILRGTKPGDIPFFQATRFELVMNIRTAQALGLEVSAVLPGADEVIE